MPRSSEALSKSFNLLTKEAKEKFNRQGLNWIFLILGLTPQELIQAEGLQFG